MTPPAAPAFDWRRQWPLGLLALVAIVRALAWLGPMALRDDLFAGDAAQHTWWMYRLADPTLFPNSLPATYFSQWFLSPPAYQAVVGTLARWFDPQRVVEAIAIGLALSAVGLAGRLGYRVGGRAGVSAALAVLCLTHAEQFAEGGFPRSFGLVIVLAGMLAVLRRRWAAFGGVVLLAALIYPPVMLNLLLPAAVAVVPILRRRERWPRSMAVCIGLCILAAGALAAVYLRPLPPEIGRTFTYAEIRDMPEWQRTGRFRFFGYRPLTFYTDAPWSGVGLSAVRIATFGALLAFTSYRWPRAIPAEAWALLAGALLLWVAAHALLFRLYLPNRYTMYAFPVFAMIWAAGLMRALPRTGTSSRGRWPALVLLLVCAAPIVMDCRAAVAAFRGPGNWVRTDGYDAAIAFLKTLPKDTRVSAHPDDTNAVPLRCRLDVLVNTEIALPMHREYTLAMRRRLDAAFDMLYATDWEQVDQIAQREQVDVFLLDTRRLRAPEDRPYMQPYGKSNLARIEAGRQQGFALLSPPAGRVIFSAGDVRILRVGKGRQ